MKYQTIYGTDISVSKICLGSMTWGEQNSETDAHAQIDCALDRGVNFIDAAELYPVPPNADTYGKTETYIGTWLKKSGRRKDVVIASKVSGPAPELAYIRNGPRLNRRHVKTAIEGSLKRLGTDYIDLYQTHWPERDVMKFGETVYKSSPEPTDGTIEDTLTVMNELIQEGKIRCVGVSNETPWGMIKHLDCSTKKKLPRIVSVQNSYSLVNRTFEFGCAEVGEKEQIGLLAYSPLAFGVLSGKYLGGKFPDGSRLALFKHFQRYAGGLVTDAVWKYKKIADRHRLNFAQMALAFVNRQPWVLSTIIGATALDQLETNIGSIDVDLSQDVVDQINAVHSARHNPAP